MPPKEEAENLPSDSPIIGKIYMPFIVIVSIALNGLRIRFWRSMVTASGIFLSIAFFSYVLTNLLLAPNLTEDEIHRQTFLAAISVMVAGVGITNSMLMSVTERFREIGTMKCLGASDNFVVKLFFVEAAFMGVLSSVAGFLFGLFGGVLLLMVGSASAVFPIVKIAVIFAASVSTGVIITFVAAYFPAHQAAKMPAAAALRTDI
jgi:predicted lysophospholipase L1 biosynthesis ABC-type transport system permease subunit